MLKSLFAIALLLIFFFSTTEVLAFVFPTTIVDESNSNGLLKRTSSKPFYKTPYGGFQAQPIILNGFLYVISYTDEGSIIAKLSLDGKIKNKWSIAGGIYGAPLELPNNRMLVLSTEGLFVVIDLLTEKIVLQKTFESGFSGSGVFYKTEDGSSLVLAVNPDGMLLGINPDTGAIQTSICLGEGAKLTGTPLVADGVIGVTSVSSQFFYGTNINDARSFKSIRTMGSALSDCSFSNGWFYFGTAYGRIYAVEARGDGVIERAVEKDDMGNVVSCCTVPLIANNGEIVLITDRSSRLHFLDAKLKPINPSFKLPGAKDTNMALSPDGRFVGISGSNEGLFYLYDLDTGMVTKSGGLSSVTVILFDTTYVVYVGDNGGEINTLKVEPSKAR